MELSSLSAMAARVGLALARYAGPVLNWFSRYNVAKRDHALVALTIAEQLEHAAQSWASIGDDNAAALRSDDPHPRLTCALLPLSAAQPTGDARADRALLPQHRDLVRHVADVNQHVDQTAAQNSVEDSFRTLESRADETAVRAWQLADAYRARFALPAPQLGGREARIRSAAFDRVTSHAFA